MMAAILSTIEVECRSKDRDKVPMEVTASDRLSLAVLLRPGTYFLPSGYYINKQLT